MHSEKAAPRRARGRAASGGGLWARIKAKWPRQVGPAWLRWLLFIAAGLCMGLAVAVAVQWVVTGSLSIVREWFEKQPSYLLLTACLYGAAVWLLGVLTGRLWLSGALVGLAGLALSLVDYFKNAINGTPLVLADFGLAAQLGEVAGVAGDLRPPEDFWRALAALLLCVLLLLLTKPLTAIRGRWRFLSFALALPLCVVLFSSGSINTVGELFQVDVYTLLDGASSHDTYGLTLSLWRDCFMEGKTGPEGYGEEYMQQVLSRLDELLAEDAAAQTPAEEPAQMPNVIMILSESFYDLTRLPDLTFDQDPLENFHALEAESISGTFHSHYLGYGTGYIEMSMLYGLTGMDLGPGTNICFLEDGIYQLFDSVAEQYTNLGDYQAEMLHAYNDSLYNRTVTYPLLGFSELFFSADIQEMGIERPGGIYGGYYMRDAYLFQGLLKRMEAINAAGQRAFLYAITMENHQPFNEDKFHYECQIGAESGTLSEEDMAIVRVMLEGITRADQALGELTEALRDLSEPTIVVFFGDHRPNLFMTDGDTVYTKLGLCPDNDTTGWTAEQINDLYSTDYLIWANDAALLQGREGTRQESSITALGPQLLELTGQPVSRYWALLEKVSEVCLTNTELYFVDGEGNASFSQEEAGLSAEAQELLELRDAVIYDAVYGEQYITAAMNRPAGQ